jgi:NhaD family Na+/H+ antiporter
MSRLLIILSGLLACNTALASEHAPEILDLTTHWVGYAAIVIFALAYFLVILEEKIHLRKSKPVLLAAGVIWILIAVAYNSHGLTHVTEEAIRHNFLEYTELFFFLLVAMTYINAMIDLGVFDELRNWLVERGYSYRMLFWITGILAFLISPIADNLTTALIMCAVILAVGQGQSRFIGLGCINIVVAANAGGAFSPFGDITTLMVWQRGVLEFGTFFKLLIPAVVNFVVPAMIMHFALPTGKPAAGENPGGRALKEGGMPVVGLFLLTIATAVSFHNFLHLPPVYGMMLGLAYLKFYGFYLRNKTHAPDTVSSMEVPPGSGEQRRFDIFDNIAKAEWDTLFFFYGVIMAVGGLGFIGYLGMASGYIYGELGPTTANVLVGLMSAIVDNIPVMFAVLTMNPDMSEFQWLLVTLTAGVGGSMLSIGSAAGVALMGQARGHYTFFGHLKWTPVIALGYAASIYVHFLVNG